MQAMQKSKEGLAEVYRMEKKELKMEVKKEIKSLQAQLATAQKEKVDLVDSHKASHFSSLLVESSQRLAGKCICAQLAFTDYAALCCAVLRNVVNYVCICCWYMLFNHLVAVALVCWHCCTAGSRQFLCSTFACSPAMTA